MKNPVYGNETQGFAHRLRNAMRQAGYKTSATVLAHEFNLRYWGASISTHAARNWLIGLSLPKQDKLRVLSEWLRVTPQDLLFGNSACVQVANDSNSSALSLTDQHMLQSFLSLSKDHQRMVREMVAALQQVEVLYKPSKT